MFYRSGPDGRKRLCPAPKQVMHKFNRKIFSWHYDAVRSLLSIYANIYFSTDRHTHAPRLCAYVARESLLRQLRCDDYGSCRNKRSKCGYIDSATAAAAAVAIAAAGQQRSRRCVRPQFKFGYATQTAHE